MKPETTYVVGFLTGLTIGVLYGFMSGMMAHQAEQEQKMWEQHR